VAGVAVAAGVATVALVGLQGGDLTDAPESAEVVPPSSIESRPWGASARFAPASAGQTLDLEESNSWERLNNYRINHTDRAVGIRRIEQASDSEDSVSESAEDGDDRGQPQ